MSMHTIQVRHALRRHREGMGRRALIWGGSAIVPAALAALALFSLVARVQNASLISGADVHLTPPVIESLTRPPRATLIDQRPGLADTETIYHHFTAQNLNSVLPH